jgi:glucokinase
MPGPVGAIDLGGTKIHAAVVDEHGRIVASDRRPTEAEGGLEAVLRRMTASLQEAATAAGVPAGRLERLGVAVAGAIDSGRGLVAEAPNLPGWHDVPLAEMLKARTGLATVIENDANCSAIGEHTFGAARGVDDVVYITVSTGIGAGIIVAGRVYGGAQGSAGEIGHMVVQPEGPRCGCGRVGCLEAMASGTAIGRAAADSIAAGRSPMLAQIAGEWGGASAEVVSIAAERGDSEAQLILAEAARYLGIGLVNVTHLLNPGMIVLGGGAARMRSRLIEPAIEQLRSHAFASMARDLRVEFAVYGDDSAVLGAAAVALRAG